MGDIFASAFDELENESEDSEDGSGASDTDSYDSDASDRSDKGKKRKRGTESAESTDGEDSDAPTNGNKNLGSNLQRRKRKAFERVSSLTQAVAIRDTPTPSDPVAGLTSNGPSADAIKEPGDQADDENDAAFAEAFEQELEAQLAAELDDGEGNVD